MDPAFVETTINRDTMMWKVQLLDPSIHLDQNQTVCGGRGTLHPLQVSIYLGKGLRYPWARGESGDSGLKTFLRPLRRPKAYNRFFKNAQKHLIISVCKTFLKITASELTFYTADKGLSDLVPSEQDKSLSVRIKACVKIKMEVEPMGWKPAVTTKDPRGQEKNREGRPSDTTRTTGSDRWVSKLMFL